MPIFELKDFARPAGELNRRMGVLSLLYNRRRRMRTTWTFRDGPGEADGVSREHLNFALWYLRAKGCSQEDNSDWRDHGGRHRLHRIAFVA